MTSFVPLSCGLVSFSFTSGGSPNLHHFFVDSHGALGDTSPGFFLPVGKQLSLKEPTDINIIVIIHVKKNLHVAVPSFSLRKIGVVTVATGHDFLAFGQGLIHLLFNAEV